MRPLISIITPTYNHRDYIGACIRSVQMQKTCRDWEMIVVDDASTDATAAVVRKIMQTDRRIKLIEHRKNWGIGKLKDTYNQALKASTGKIIALLEGDDYWPADKLELQLPSFADDKKAVASYGRWDFVSNSGKRIYTRSYRFDRDKLNNRPVGSVFDLFLTLRFDIASSTVLIRREALEQIGGFQTDGHYPFVDIPTYLALGKLGNFVFVDRVVGCYRRSHESAWFSFASSSTSMGRKEMMQCINSYVARNVGRERISRAVIDRQKRYLAVRKYTNALSVIFNKIIS